MLQIGYRCSVRRWGAYCVINRLVEAAKLQPRRVRLAMPERTEDEQNETRKPEQMKSGEDLVAGLGHGRDPIRLVREAWSPYFFR